MERVRNEEAGECLKQYLMAFSHLEDDPRNSAPLRLISNYVYFLENYINDIEAQLHSRAKAETTQKIAHLIPEAIDQLKVIQEKNELSQYTTV